MIFHKSIISCQLTTEKLKDMVRTQMPSNKQIRGSSNEIRAELSRVSS